MAYDSIKLTPGTAPGSPYPNQIYCSSSDNRLYVCTDGTGTDPSGYSDLRLTPAASPPTAALGRIYYDSDDDHLYLCMAT